MWPVFAEIIAAATGYEQSNHTLRSGWVALGPCVDSGRPGGPGRYWNLAVW